LAVAVGGRHVGRVIKPHSFVKLAKSGRGDCAIHNWHCDCFSAAVVCDREGLFGHDYSFTFCTSYMCTKESSTQVRRCTAW